MTERYDPFSEVERLLDQFTQSAGSATLPVDVLETEDEVVVRADLPGRESGDLEVRLEGDRTLHVDAAAAERETEGTVVSSECERGPVSRSVRLPSAVEADETAASYEQGVLEVRLARRVATEDGTDIPVN